MNEVFANRSKKDKTYSLTTEKIAEAQWADGSLKHLFKCNAVIDQGLEFKLIENTTCVCKDDWLVMCVFWSLINRVVCCKACNSNRQLLPPMTPIDSVVLPLGILGGACTREFQQGPVSWFGLYGHSLGAVPQPRLLSPSGLHCRHFWEKRRCVSVLLPQHGTTLTLRGNS
jgi:hypothetical protein